MPIITSILLLCLKNVLYTLTEKPIVEITTATGGCGYIYVSWIVIGNISDDAMCSIGHLNIILSSVEVSIAVSTSMISYNFTGLPDNTLFNVTIIATSINEKNIVDLAFTSVRTIESMHVQMCLYISYSGIVWQVEGLTNLAQYLKFGTISAICHPK